MMFYTEIYCKTIFPAVVSFLRNKKDFTENMVEQNSWFVPYQGTYIHPSIKFRGAGGAGAYPS